MTQSASNQFEAFLPLRINAPPLLVILLLEFIYCVVRKSRVLCLKKITSLEDAKTLDIVKRIEFFDSFTGPELETLIIYHGEIDVAEEGEVIIQEGETSCSLYVLLSGSIKVFKGNHKKALAYLAPGDIFGEISFLTRIKRITSCTAQSKSIVMKISHTTLNNLGATIRDKIKDKIILKLISRLDSLHARYYDEVDSHKK